MFRAWRSCHRTRITRMEVLLCVFIVLLLMNIIGVEHLKVSTADLNFSGLDQNVQNPSELKGIIRTTTKFQTPPLLKAKHTLSPQEKVKIIMRDSKKLRKFEPMLYPLKANIKAVAEDVLSGKEVQYNVINPHPYHYIHNPKTRCGNGSLFVVVLVKSRVSNREYRESIRNTWGSVFKNDSRLVFLLGMSDNASVQENVSEESRKHEDIIQENFLDEYCNNTLKTIMAFNWAVQYCSKARYHFYVDDDVFLIKDKLKFLDRPPVSEKSLFIGKVFPNSVPYRDNGSKWFVSWEDYPFDRWPPYIAGGAFVTSSYTSRMLSAAFPYVKYLGIDDAYLGIVAKKLNLKLTTWHGFMMSTPKVTPLKLNYKSVIAYHRIDQPKKMYIVWDNYLKFQNASLRAVKAEQTKH